MENRLKQLHEWYMREKQHCHVDTETPRHQAVMKNVIVEMLTINQMMDMPEHYDRIQSHYEKDHCKESVNRDPLSREEAHDWVKHMEPTGGGDWTPWSVEQTTEMLTEHGVTLGKLSDWCANALLNMLWSDNPAWKKEKVLEEAKKYVKDPDVAPANQRLGIYYRYIVKH